MIDFSKLSRPRSAAERARDDEIRRAQNIVNDLKRREERWKIRINLKLTDAAEVRHTMSGDRVLHLRGDGHRGRPAAACWFAPDYLEAGAVNALLEQLVEGAAVLLHGYWTAREFAGVKRFEFVAQFIQIGDGPKTP
jgi:hypothetical protein